TAPVAAISEPKPNSHWLQYQTIPAFGTATDADAGVFYGGALYCSLTVPYCTMRTAGVRLTFGGPPTGLAPGSYALSMMAAASDAGSGLRSVFCTVDGNPATGLKDTDWASASFSRTFTETATGAHAVACTASHLDYITATATDNVYDFVGFMQPVDNPATVNT